MAAIKEETAPIKCGPCLFDGNTVEPRYFCVDCLEYLCTECIRDHRRNKSSRKHKILEEEELPMDIKLFEKMKKLSDCTKHTDIEIDQYCPTHDVLICRYCLQKDHTLCEGLCDMSCDLDEESRRKKVEQNIHDLRRKCETNYTEMMQTLEEAQNGINKVQKDINNIIHILKHNIDILEKTLNERVENETQRLRLSEQKMSTLQQKVSCYTDLHAITSKYGTSKQRIALDFKVSTLLKELETDSSAKSVKDKHIQFIQPTQVEDIITMLHQFDVVRTRKDIQTSELSSDEASLYEDAVNCIEPNSEEEAKHEVETLATCKMVPQEEETFATCEMVPVKNLLSLQVIRDRISLIKLESLNAETGVFETCVVAVDILSDGRTILLLGENTLQLHSKKLSLTSKYKLQHKVKDMCFVEENKNGAFQVAVCFYQSCKIICLEHVSEFLEKHEINCSHTVVNISMYVHHLVALVERKSSKSSYEIQLLDIPTGCVCYAFDEFKLSSAQFSYMPGVSICKPNRISTCKTTMKVIVAGEQHIYRFNINDGECEPNTSYAVGQCEWKYRTDVVEPFLLNYTNNVKCVKCDRQGNMYVSAFYGLYQLYNFNAGKCSVRSIIPNCRRVASFAIDEIRNRIIVGYMGADRVHVFEYIIPTDT